MLGRKHSSKFWRLREKGFKRKQAYVWFSGKEVRKGKYNKERNKRRMNYEFDPVNFSVGKMNCL